MNRVPLALLSGALLCAACTQRPSEPSHAQPARAAAPAPPSPSASPMKDAPRAPIDQEPELGQVRWRRDYAEARKAALARNLRLFVLFDEVPG